MDGLVAELLEGARAEMAVVAEHGGAVKAVDYMKAALVDSHRERLRRIEAGEQIVVGLNRYEDSEPSPLLQGADGGILTVDTEVEAQQREAVAQWRASRDQAAVDDALKELARVAEGDENIMPSQIAASALQEGVHVVGLSILSGSHRELIPSVMEALRERGVDVPVVVGGIIPEADVEPLKVAGVAAVYTPKDFDITKIMRDVVTLVAERNGVATAAA